MALCLDQLLNNKKSSPFTLINSSTRFSALPLLAEFSTRALEDDNGLIVIVTETSPKAWFDRICTAKAKNAFVIDAYTDPFGWDDANDAFTVVQESLPVHVVRNLQDMEHAILAPVIQKTQNGSSFTIVIDSLHPLLMISPHRTYQLVKALESLTTGKRATRPASNGTNADSRLRRDATYRRLSQRYPHSIAADVHIHHPDD